MLILLPAGLLFITAFALVLLPRLRPKFSSHWLVAVGGAFLAWVSLVMLESIVPQSLVLSVWRPTNLIPASPDLIFDEISWSLGLAISTLGLSIILVDVRRSASSSSSEWAYVLILVGLGIFSTLSANWLTLALTWTLIDLVIRLIRWPNTKKEDSRERILFGFSGNLIAVVIFAAGIIISDSSQLGEIDGVPSSTTGMFLVILAIAIRLGITIVDNEVIAFGNRNWSLQSLFLFVPSVATLSLVVRISSIGNFQTQALNATALLLAAAFYGAIKWTRSKTTSIGISYWIFSAGFLALAAALLNYPKIALAWGVILIYVGSYSFLAAQNSRRAVPISALVLFSFSILPFSPSYASQELYSSSSSISFLVPLILIHALLLYGFLRHIYRIERKTIGTERWIEVISILGMAWLPLTHLLLAQNVIIAEISQITTLMLWPAAAGIGISTIFVLLGWRKIGIPEPISFLVGRVFSFRWIIRLLKWVERAIRGLIELFTAVLEGEGGVLWALLLVALLASFLNQMQVGG